MTHSPFSDVIISLVVNVVFFTLVACIGTVSLCLVYAAALEIVGRVRKGRG